MSSCDAPARWYAYAAGQVTEDALRGDAAVALLHSLCGPDGIHASTATATNYRAIFARDAVMAGIAGLLLDDAVVMAGLARTLGRLRDLQGPQGQVASNFEMQEGGPGVSFGTLAPRFDASTWYLVGVGLAATAGAIEPRPFHASVQQVVELLDTLEYNGRHLLYVPAGGNWADEYVYDGYILYDQVLRAWGLKLVGDVFDERRWTRKSGRISTTIAERYWPTDRADRGHPIASFSPLGQRDTFDLAACSLLAVSGVGDDLGARALARLSRHFLLPGRLPPAFDPVIREGDRDWDALRAYHLHAFRNFPHEYHNGGVWPIWLGWLALGQAQLGLDADLARLRELVAEALVRHPGYAFEEFLHGETGEPGGVKSMAYSAAGLTFLRLAGTRAQARVFST